MRVLKVYKNLDITFGELDKAMSKLRLHKKVMRVNDPVREAFFGKPIFELVYFHKSPAFKFLLLHQEDECLVPKREIVKLSEQLTDFGFTAEFDDLAKMVEKERQQLSVAA